MPSSNQTQYKNFLVKLNANQNKPTCKIVKARPPIQPKGCISRTFVLNGKELKHTKKGVPYAKKNLYLNDYKVQYNDRSGPWARFDIILKLTGPNGKSLVVKKEHDTGSDSGIGLYPNEWKSLGYTFNEGVEQKYVGGGVNDVAGVGTMLVIRNRVPIIAEFTNFGKTYTIKTFATLFPEVADDDLIGHASVIGHTALQHFSKYGVISK